MGIEEMRSYIIAAYPGRSWRAKCNMMGPQQVVAVYRSVTERKAKETKKRVRRSSKPGYQLTIFDFGVRKETE